MTIGNLLKKARIKLALSNRDVEKEIGLGSGSVSRYENDRTQLSFKTAVRLARLYGVKLKLMADKVDKK